MKIKSYQCKLKLKMKNLKDYSLTSFNIWFVAICQNYNGKAIEKKMSMDPNEKKKHASKRLKNGSRRERKLKTNIKGLRQLEKTTNKGHTKREEDN